ncbi:MAG: DUF3078 domain-containing protein [Dysgonamonadaceae bacterium]|jgi:hypothetical protein|nr:DUF3078 domain-containing protein [Dysgonamonadaceae bacterium]
MPQSEMSQPQDSILNFVTDIRNVWNKKQTYYFANANPDQELRFYNITLDGRHRFYRDLLLDPFYDPENYPVTYNDTLVWDPVYLPIIFTGKVFVDNCVKVPDVFGMPLSKIYPLYDLSEIIKAPQVAMSDYEKEFRQRVYLNTILSDVSTVKYFHGDLASYEAVKPEVLKVNVSKDLFSLENNPDFSNAGSPARYATKRRYWIVNGTHLFQISEGYVSDNWYKGGVSSINIQSNQKVTFNYKKGKIQNNNEIRWDLAMHTNPNDSLRTTRIGNDLLRSYSDFGIVASNNWNYSTNLELKTQLFNNYKENTTVKKAAFLSPFFLNMGVLGMKYQLTKTSKTNKNKNFTVTSDISPLSIKYTYIRDSKAVDPTGYGVPAGKNDTLVVGSSINSTFKINFNKGISFSTRFKCFTDYRKLELESENELNLAINRYFSTRIFLYVRFDDSKGIVPDPKFAYWQINQILSFGLNYNW